MTWTTKEVCRIRKSLNWSRSQLSSRLGCSLDIIFQIESGSLEISEELCLQLNQLKNQTDFIFEQRKNQPHAEKIMQEQGLTQISKELIDELKEKE